MTFRQQLFHDLMRALLKVTCQPIPPPIGRPVVDDWPRAVAVAHLGTTLRASAPVGGSFHV